MCANLLPERIVMPLLLICNFNFYYIQTQVELYISGEALDSLYMRDLWSRYDQRWWFMNEIMGRFRE